MLKNHFVADSVQDGDEVSLMENGDITPRLQGMPLYGTVVEHHKAKNANWIIATVNLA